MSNSTDTHGKSTTLQLQIEGMSCQSCSARLEKMLNQKYAITQATVNFASEQANIEYDAEQADVDQIISWVAKAGFTAKEFTLDSVDPHASFTDNIHSKKMVDVGFSSEDDSGFNVKSILPQKIKPIVKSKRKSNDSAKSNDNTKATSQPATSSLSGLSDYLLNMPEFWRVLALFVCMLPFMVGMLGMMIGKDMAWMPPMWAQFAIATLVQFTLATPFYRSAWASLKGGMANMDVLVVLGSLTIWSYSSFVWFAGMLGDGTVFGQPSHQHIYFEAGVMIIAFVRLGKYLEARTKKQSLNVIDMMMSLTPTTVERQSDIGDFHEVDLVEVAIGDVLRAKHGSRVATDGVVVEGEGWCNESHLTGESKRLYKEMGDRVLAGALVEDGSLTYRVNAKGADSRLGDMIKALNEAQGSKAPIARLADKIAGVFVPVVILLALITAAVTFYITQSVEQAILHSVAVLVVACPCALGLATPAAIMAGMGVAARHGILFKDAQSLEQAGQLDTVVMDKTGTLTKGHPTLVAHLLMDKSLNYNEVLQFAASVESHVSHPFARCLVQSAKQLGLSMLPVTDVKVVAGRGVQANLIGYGIVKVGNADWLNVKLPDDIAKRMPKVLKSSSLVAVSIDDVPLAIFTIADDIREESKQTVDSLKKLGLNVVLMSGDKESVVASIAHKLEISETYAQMTPRNKAEKISAMQAEGQKIAMVGDGVNDAPAMVMADASFAMSDGTDIAQHSASARLMGGSLYQMYEAHKIANATVRNIKENLFLAFVYNIIAIPLAALGYLTPVIAAGMMSLSSIFVLMNALKLSKFSVKELEEVE